MRQSFIRWLESKAQSDSSIILLTADLGYSVLDDYAIRYPDQYLNVGVAEQNLVGIASGLAFEGCRPYTYSIANFPTLRCAEQLRNNVDYHGLNVVTCSVGGGLAYGNLGYSHHAIQDLAFVRSLPNTIIACPCDCLDVVAILDWHYEHPSPLYLRLHKSGEPTQLSLDYNFTPGSFRQVWPHAVHHGSSTTSNTCIVALGHLVDQTVKLVRESNSSLAVYTLPLWGEPFRRAVSNELQRYEHVIVIEDHVLQGGLSSYFLETIAAFRLSTTVYPIALDAGIIGSVASENVLLAPLFDRLRSLITSDPIS